MSTSDDAENEGEAEAEDAGGEEGGEDQEAAEGEGGGEGEAEGEGEGAEAESAEAEGEGEAAEGEGEGAEGEGEEGDEDDAADAEEGSADDDPWSVDPHTVQGLVGVDEDSVNRFFDELPEKIKTALREKHAQELRDNKERAFNDECNRANELLKQGGSIALMLIASEQPSPEKRQEVLENALVGLVGAELGEKYKGKALPGKVKTLFDLARGKLSDEQKTEQLHKELVDLVKTLGGEKAGDLAEQIDTLGQLVLGNPTPEQRAEIFKTAVTGLLERTVFSGWASPIYLKAFLAGYEFAAPIGNWMAENLKVAIKFAWQRDLLSAIMRDESLNGPLLQRVQQGGGARIAVDQEPTMKAWTANAYWDDQAQDVRIQVIDGANQARIFDSAANLISDPN